MGAIRDAKGKAVATVFKDLGGDQKAAILQALLAKGGRQTEVLPGSELMCYCSCGIRRVRSDMTGSRGSLV